MSEYMVLTPIFDLGQAFTSMRLEEKALLVLRTLKS